MNPLRFQELIDRYIAAFEMTNNTEHREYYKWQIAKKFRSAMDEVLEASDDELSRKLYEVKKKTYNLIDSYTQPLNGLVNYAKREPATVRRMFRELFSVAEADFETKEAAIFRFMDDSLALRDKHYPESYLYKEDLHSVTGYLFLYDPDHNYLYKASHSRIFADCIEFYDDWGSGPDTKLDIFNRMCDECIRVINESPALLETAKGRYRFDPEGMHPDTEKHILLFDMIYCCSSYHLFDGIRFVVPKSKERQLMQERKDKARELKRELDEANRKAAELEQVLNRIWEGVIPGKTVRHKAFGTGKVTALGEEHRAVISFETGEKELGIRQSITNGLITVEGLELSEEQENLLRNEGVIRSMVTCAEKAIEPYWEYLE